MTIELLQTMQWSKLCWDLSFEKVIDLDMLLPQVGKTYPVSFDENEDFVKEGRAFLLWQPPHSELNGWYDKRPSEILKSFVLEGVLKQSISGGLNFDFEVISRTKLVDFFHRAIEVRKTPLSDILFFFDDSMKLRRNVLKAEVGGYLYLSVTCPETSLDAILSSEKNALCLHYLATLPAPSLYETIITKYYLNQQECIVFDRLISEAGGIYELPIEILAEDRIYGAEYW